MARLNLQFPEDQYCFSTQLTVRITDINAANHLANDSMISMISEARARFLFAYGVPETRQDGSGIIVTDLATTYKAEAHARDALLFEVGVMDFNKYGGDIIFRITQHILEYGQPDFPPWRHQYGRDCRRDCGRGGVGSDSADPACVVLRALSA